MANETQGAPGKKPWKSRWEGGGVKKCCHPWGGGWIFSGITHFTSGKKQIMHDLFLTIES